MKGLITDLDSQWVWITRYCKRMYVQLYALRGDTVYSHGMIGGPNWDLYWTDSGDIAPDLLMTQGIRRRKPTCPICEICASYNTNEDCYHHTQKEYLWAKVEIYITTSEG